MAQKDIKERGHVLLAAVIGVAVVVVGIGVWQFVRTRQDDGKPSAQQVSQEEGRQASEEVEAVTPSGDGYLTIEEWGVRVLLPEPLRGDVSYFVNTKVKEDFGVDRVDFVSKQFSAGQLKCAVIEGDTPRSVTAIMREEGTTNGETLDPAPFKRIDDARYYSVKTACDEAITREGSQKDKQLLESLEAAISTTLEKL